MNANISKPSPINADDLANWHDPLASKISWDNLTNPMSNFATGRLFITSETTLELKRSVGFSVFAWAFILSGIIPLILAFKNPLLLIFSAVFIGLGAGALYWGFSPTVFDQKKGTFQRGRNPSADRDSYCKLEDIHAIQILHKWVETNDIDTEDYDSYEVNLVLHSGYRLHVIEYPQGGHVWGDAAKLADFLNVPVWDNSPKHLQYGADEPSVEENALRFPWFSLIVPNIILLIGILAWGWNIAEVIWMFLIEGVVNSIGLLACLAINQKWRDFASGIGSTILLLMFVGLLSFGVYAIFHNAESSGDFSFVQTTLPPTTRWFILMAFSLLFARALALLTEYVLDRKINSYGAEKQLGYNIVWVFMVVWAGFMISAITRSTLGFIIAIISMRIIVSLAGYAIAHWRHQKQQDRYQPT